MPPLPFRMSGSYGGAGGERVHANGGVLRVLHARRTHDELLHLAVLPKHLVASQMALGVLARRHAHDIRQVALNDARYGQLVILLQMTTLQHDDVQVFPFAVGRVVSIWCVFAFFSCSFRGRVRRIRSRASTNPQTETPRPFRQRGTASCRRAPCNWDNDYCRS